MRSRQGQSGLTIIGFIFVAVVVLTVALIGFRVAPSYIEYFSVQKILYQALQNSRDGVTLAEFRRDFDRRAGADYIESVGPSDVDLRKDDDTLVASADWTTTLHLVGNASLLLEFHASASKEPSRIP
jgi:Domain of unknown function (DUF4845)